MLFALEKSIQLMGRKYNELHFTLSETPSQLLHCQQSMTRVRKMVKMITHQTHLSLMEIYFYLFFLIKQEELIKVLLNKFLLLSYYLFQSFLYFLLFFILIWDCLIFSINSMCPLAVPQLILNYFRVENLPVY